MNDLLLKIGLLDKLTFKLDTTRDEFVKRFQQNVDPDQFEFFEMFSSSKNQYKGSITLDSFVMKRRVAFGASNFVPGSVDGTFLQRNEKLIIEANITGFSGFRMKFFLIALCIFYSVALAFTINAIFLGDGSSAPAWSIPFIFVHAAVMFGIPYFMMRSAVRKIKYDLERDIFFMMR
jgi:hypothetical protein